MTRSRRNSTSCDKDSWPITGEQDKTEPFYAGGDIVARPTFYAPMPHERPPDLVFFCCKGRIDVIHHLFSILALRAESGPLEDLPCQPREAIPLSSIAGSPSQTQSTIYGNQFPAYHTLVERFYLTR